MTPLTFASLAMQLPPQAGRMYVGYSGGVDSHVLLHLLASDAGLRPQLTAVYVHHGLQTAADDWHAHCQHQCRQLGVAYRMLTVDARPEPGESPEAAARAARYAAFRQLLQAGDELLFAQHREDQAETLLLQLLRGAGPHGLAGMPRRTAFGRGWLQRPLLHIGKAQILAYASRHGLHWVEDPSNQSCDFDRNYLRHQVIPVLKNRWPAMDKTLARAAGHCAAAARLLDTWAAAELPRLLSPAGDNLALAVWRGYDADQRHWLLRRWLQVRGLRPVSTAGLQALVEQVIDADAAAEPELHLQQQIIARYRDHLYCLPQTDWQPQAPQVWPSSAVQITLAGGQVVSRMPAGQGIATALWHAHQVTLDCRRGGESIRLPGRQGSRSLKKLYQAAGIPPWERRLRPLVYLDGKLAAVAGLWIADWAFQPHGDCYALHWQPETGNSPPQG